MSWIFYYGSMKNVLIRGANLIKNQDFIELSKPSLKLFQVFELQAYIHFLSKFQLPKIFLNSRSPTQKPHVLRTMYTRAGPVLPETEKPTVLTQISENRNRHRTEI